MRRMIQVGLGLVAVLVFSIAMTSSASATSFLSSISKAKILSEKVENQVFTTSNGNVECSEAKVEKGETGTAGSEELVQLAEIKYENCLAFGFVPTEISNADYLFLPNGTVHIDKLVRILASNGCETSVPPQLTTGTLYANSGNNIKITNHVSGIKYTANKCTFNGSFTNGTYKGSSESMISGGTLSFMP